MKKTDKRLQRERKTIEKMVLLYCRLKHTSSEKPCSDCGELLRYALSKIDRCIFGDSKPACSECRVHCYAHDKREKIRIIMRYAGPKMMYYHPYLGIMHFVDKYRYDSEKKK